VIQEGVLKMFVSCVTKILLPCLTSSSSTGPRSRGGQALPLGMAQLGHKREYAVYNGKMNEKTGSTCESIMQKGVPQTWSLALSFQELALAAWT